MSRTTRKLTRASLHIVTIPKGVDEDGLAVGDRLPLATTTKVGASTEVNDYALPDGDVAPESFEIVVEDSDFICKAIAGDIAVNGTTVSAPTTITPDDLITVGSWTFKFALGF